MSTKVAVVVPVYRELNELEKISLAQCRKVLGRYPLIFVAPEGRNFSFVEAGDMVAHFPTKYFQSRDTYSELLMTPQFYETFAPFEYILIYQTDAFAFYDALKEFCSLGYDYIGSPWPYSAWPINPQRKTLRVGNGGFSLRKVKACQRVVREFGASNVENLAEDAFLSKCGLSRDIDFNVAPVEVANLFAMERYPARHVKRFGLPFGCHYWTSSNADFYMKTFRRFGYDLRPLRELMACKDYETLLPMCLANIAMHRLIRAAEQGRSLLEYLPTKRFASIRVIRSPGAVKLLSRLLTEENSLTDKIFAYDEVNWTNLLRDVEAEDLPHLLIAEDYDASLIKALERGGLRYGQHFVSLQREYVKSREKLFHNLGK